MKNWILPLVVLFAALIVYTLVKAAWPEAMLARVLVAGLGVGAAIWIGMPEKKGESRDTAA